MQQQQPHPAQMQHAESLVGMKGVLRNNSGEVVRASVAYRENKKLAYTLAAEIKADQGGGE